MPEFKRNFTKGRMNKDLDERMVPNGEYRDALNVEVATSEGSNVGTVQTLKGNTALTALFGEKASCVGKIADEKNNKIYWFVQDELTKNPDASVVYSQAEQDASGTVSVVHDVFSDYIMEYDEVKLETNYVVVEHWKIKTTITNDSHGTGDHLHISDFGYPGDIRYAGIQVGMDVYIDNMLTTVTKIEPDNTGDWNGWRVYTKHDNSDTGFLGLGTITAGTTVTFAVPYKKRALGFRFFAKQNPGKIITGINIIDDLLFWTDGLTEPKKINIKRCIYGSQQLDPNYQSAADITTGVFPYKNGTRAFPTLLVVNGEQPSYANGRLGSQTTYSSVLTHTFLSYLHTTVIKKSPIDPLILTMSNTTKPDHNPQDGLVIVDTEVTVGGDFFFNPAGDRLGNGDPAGASLTFNPGMDWEEGDVIEWFAEDDDAGFQNEPIAVLVVESVLNGNTFTFRIQSISNILIKPYRDFRVRLQQDDPLFEFKFPRFAYRWKYEDGEYSCYSPFSDVAFLPDEFDYLPKKGYNLGMTNNLRYLVLSGFKPKTMPLDVVEIDILYKESNSPNVYTVDTIKAPSVAVRYLGTDNFDYADANAWFGRIKHQGVFQEIPTTLDTSSQLVGVSALTGGNTGDFYTLEDRFSDINIKVGDVITLGTVGDIGAGTIVISGMQDTSITVGSIVTTVSQISITVGGVTVTGSTGTWLTAGNTVTFNRNIAVKPAVYVNDPIGSFHVKSDMIHATVPSNQLLRPYDNVPKSALAQEITGNRVVYGNYVQNYNLVDFNNKLTKVSFKTSLHNRSNVRQNVRYDDRTALVNQTNGSTLNWWDEANQITPTASKPERSLKSLRDYQFGVVYMDEFGRQTPIQTHDNAVKRIPKSYANKYNSLRIQLDPNESTFPEWATHFKFYIKENANEYYNLAMDRFYSAEDGNIWLSFPSSERNKVDEETFLILKKQHDNDTFVSEKARYKILAISNEAPLFVKTKMDSFGIVASNSIYFPKIDGQFADIAGGLFVNTSLADALDANNERVMRVSNATNKSRWYDVVSITKNGSNQRITVSKKFGADVAFTTDDNTNSGSLIAGGVSIELAKKEIKNLPEFSGRFFVKIHKDGTFLKNITARAVDRSFVVTNTIKLGRRKAPYSKTKKRNFWVGGGSYEGIPAKKWFVDECSAEGVHQSDKVGMAAGFEYGKGIHGNDTKIDIAFHWFDPKQEDNPWHVLTTSDPGVNSTHRQVARTLITAGTLFRWKDDTTVYKITHTEHRAIENYSPKPHLHNYNEATNHREKFRVTFTPKLGVSGLTDAIGKPSSGFNPLTESVPGTQNDWYSEWSNLASDQTEIRHRRIEILEEFAADESYTSDNPAIWETEPKENIDIDLYNEASAALPIEREFDTYKNEFYASSRHTSYNVLDYYNCFSFNNGVESNRIRDDYNTVTIDKGPKVSTVLAEQYKEEHRKSGLIYSGIFNSTSGVNNLNQFIQFEKITKDINPTYGSIQKLHSRDTDLITFCEDRVIKVLANKDALFNADGNSNVTSTNNVLGNAIPYAGDYGISTDPGSFAVDQYRAYFTDKSRGVVLRLSQDGLTPISDLGMRDYFKDASRVRNSAVLGSYDENKKLYNLTMSSNGAATGADLAIPLQNGRVSLWNGLATVGEPLGNWTSLGLADPAWLNYHATGGTMKYPSPIPAANGFGAGGSNVSSGDDVLGPHGIGALPIDFTYYDDLAVRNSADTAGWGGIQLSANSTPTDGLVITDPQSFTPNVNIPGSPHPVSLYPVGMARANQGVGANYNSQKGDTVKLWFSKWTSGYPQHGHPSHDTTPNWTALISALNVNGPGNVYMYQNERTYAHHPYKTDFLTGALALPWVGNPALYFQGVTFSYPLGVDYLGNPVPTPIFQPEAVWAIQSITYNSTSGGYEVGAVWLCGNPIQGDTQHFVWSLKGPFVDDANDDGVNITISYSEDTKGWTSFKSWLQQTGVSINDKYFTFSGGELYQHHDNDVRNNFYGTQYSSTFCVLFNDMPSSVKNFSSLSYEGSQSKIDANLTGGEYYNNIAQTGWFAESIITDLETGQIPEFKEKEGKWFNFIRGNKANNLANLNVKQFSTQGIGRLSAIAVTVPAPAVRNALTVQDVGDID